MQGVQILLLLAGSLAVTAVARRLDWPAPLLLVAVGLAVSFVPGMPDFRLEPELVLVIVLPPLLYSSALDSSYVNIRRNIRPIGLLAIGLVLATTLGVGLVAHLAIPALPLPAALVLGALVAPPDAVAAVAIGRKLGLPRRIMTLLTGLYLGHNAPRAGYATRLQETAVWRAVDLLLESWVFGLIGLQLRFVLADSGATWPLFGSALLVLLAAMVIRIVWVYPGTYLPRLLSPKIRAREEFPTPQGVFIVAWTGMRGVVSLAAASALPLDMPGWDVIVLCTFVVTVGTLMVQGLSLPGLIRLLKVPSDDASSDSEAEARVKSDAARAAIARLEQASDGNVPERVIARLRTMAEHRADTVAQSVDEGPGTRWKRLRLSMLMTEREVFLAARDARDIDDELFHRVQRELDLEEAALTRE
ncbi:cation:proton antiporter [Kutzneria sp. CA-103260]|uniref:cation:proton antiporter n=1 Tax=Kutzneria sp. CA-103260 TaxID=2802641 RepID=UPI001BF03ECF|nr:cation:proton antiporter [Kutzneria sp. CA-103260]QUQ70234.1 Sodium/hydrogen exchanger family protein [Kutzneria sp. CA-103260]